ncbi:hypothetical protein PoB_001180500 [Plakobranchus ocellatus]|uniref:Uncharacterized protein n=1 Tax=Plakobranchus ocellatus TaxID=259542 RepID=A0AAV3YS81_9GAST|nr:hypothetical protein PoB_001180500 [Plakobranchus ocellatus]
MKFKTVDRPIVASPTPTRSRLRGQRLNGGRVNQPVFQEKAQGEPNLILVIRGVGGSVGSEFALRFAGTLLSSPAIGAPA